jgi:KDO2-lipid IV(A) lauroyltransferase
MRKLNEMLEEWICERPEQWLWLHRRWPEETYQAAKL